MGRTRRLAAPLALLAVVSVCVASWAVDPVHNVTQDLYYTSIQAAIDGATGGDTIEVAAGTYHESLASWKDMEITKSLSLIGAGSGETIIELREGPMNGVEIGGAGLSVLIQGVTFTREGANDHSSSFALRIGETTSTFDSLILRDVEVAYANGPNVNLCSKGTFADVVIEDCNFHDAGTWGFLVQGTVDQMTVTNSTFSDNGQVDAGHGIGFDLTGYVTNVTLSGGTFNGNTSCGINLMRVTDSSFTGFEASNNGQFGVKLDEWGGKSESLVFEDFSAVGNGLDGITIQPEKDDAISDVTVRNAWLSGNGRNGVNLCYVYSGSNNPEMEGIVVTGCYLDGNGNRGVAVYSWWVPMTITDTFDASGNWWGTDDPAVLAGLIDPARLDFSPILNGGDDGDPGTPGWQPDLSSVTVHTLGQQVGSTGRVQEGVDLVLEDGTVNVATGTYAETVTLDKDGISVIGDSGSRPTVTGGLKLDTNLAALTLRNLGVSGDAVAGKNSVVRMYGAITDLAIDNCVFDGEDVSGRCGLTGGQLEGDVAITNCEFKNILGWALLDSRSGSDGDGSALGTVTFANNYVHDSNGSVVFRGLSSDRTDLVNAYGNVWERIGGNAGETGEQWAALEVNRAAVVNAYGNTIDGVSLGEWDEGQAFQFWDIDDLRCGLNVIVNNAQGIWVYGGAGAYSVPGGVVTLNKISGNAEYGISVDTTALGGPLDAAGNWWGSADGPTAYDNVGTLIYEGGGDKASGSIIFSPWLGTDPDGDPTSPGVQLSSPLYIVVDDVGPVPPAKTVPGYVSNTVAGYLNRAIGIANEIAGADVIEVRHGTYDGSEPITGGATIVSESGSALHTTLNGNVSIDGDGVLIGLPLQGFRINGDVTVGVGANAGTSRINWSDLYGYVTNSGAGTFDAQYNYWGTKEVVVIEGRTTGLIDYEPFLPKNADDSYTDIVVLLGEGLVGSVDAGVQALWAMDQLGQDVATFIQYQSVAGSGAGPGGAVGAQINFAAIAGGGGGIEGALFGTYTVGDPLGGSFTVTDPVTGEPITDAAVTVSLVGPDGGSALAFWGAATYDEGTGEYVFSIDTTGMAPGTYDLIIQTHDGQSRTLKVVIEEP